MRCLAFALVVASIGMFADVAAGQVAPATSLAPSFVPSPAIAPGVANAQSRAALIMQLQAQEAAFQSTPKQDPARPTLALQLAEAYAALASVALSEKINAQTKRQQLQAAGNPSAARHQKDVEDQADAVIRAARKRAIAYGSLITTDHPTFAQIDRVRIHLAQDYEDANDRSNARMVYDDLIKKNPGSPYVPRAHLALAELFFEEAQTDPSKLDLAAKAYVEVTKYPPPQNSVYGYAWYRLAFVHWNKGDTNKARHAFKQASDFGTAYPQLPGATALGNAARTDSAALPP